MSSDPDTPVPEERWFLPGVKAIGAASLLSDLGHEVPTALLPGFLRTTLGAPAAALGIIEGVADGTAGVAKFVGGPLADDPETRKQVVVGGYVSTAVLSSAIGLATAAWQVGVLRSAAWAARGVRGPARNALLADIVPAEAYGRAYGFERAMDNLGAIGGPLLALLLVAVVGVRAAIVISIVPGLLAAAAIVTAVRSASRLNKRERRKLKFHVRAVLHGKLGRLMGGIGAFELSNVAATFLILRATELLHPGEGSSIPTFSVTAILLYAGYNAAATVIAVPGGHLTDRVGSSMPGLILGAAAYAVAFVGLAFTGGSVLVLALCFGLAGLGMGLGEAAQSAAVASHAPVDLRGSAFGLVATVQAAGNLLASVVAGLLWTYVSPEGAFLYLAVWAGIAVVAFVIAR